MTLDAAVVEITWITGWNRWTPYSPTTSLWWTYKKLWKMAIEIVDFPIKNGDFPWQNVSSPEGNHHRSQPGDASGHTSKDGIWINALLLLNACEIVLLGSAHCQCQWGHWDLELADWVPRTDELSRILHKTHTERPSVHLHPPSPSCKQL